MTHSQILAPVVALVLWTWVMWVWMYATRIPAIQRYGIKMDNRVPGHMMLADLPAKVRWKADNYNHLMEQPTIFYAIALTLAVAGAGNGVNAWIAWAYVGVRVIHSLIQAVSNRIMLRFSIFVVASLVLAVLTFRAALVVFA